MLSIFEFLILAFSMVIMWVNFKSFFVRIGNDSQKLNIEPYKFTPINTHYIEYVTLLISKWSIGWLVVGVITYNMQNYLGVIFLSYAAINSLFAGVPFLYAAIRIKSRKAVIRSTGSLLTALSLGVGLYVLLRPH
jgi:hypothetical protein